MSHDVPSADSGRRRLAVWWPDWPVTAAVLAENVSPHRPIAIHSGPTVVAVSAVARTLGVRRGMRRRTAQGVCPELVLIPADEGRDVRIFDTAVTAVETVIAGVEVARPGLVLAETRGPVRYLGSEGAVAQAIIGAVADAGFECQVGMADGMLAVVLAARRHLIVAPGTSADFLAPLPIGELEHVGPGYLHTDVVAGSLERLAGSGPVAFTSAVVRRQISGISDLIDVLQRLGIRRLSEFATLPARDIATRFGRDALVLHRLASGLDGRALTKVRPVEDIAVSIDLDPPADRVDTAAFAARRLAEEFQAVLLTSSLTCDRVRIDVRTTGGEELQRVWRHEGELDAGSLTDRVRWQLEGWISGRSGGQPSGALTKVGLVAQEVSALGTRQGELWDTVTADDRRARRTLTRVQHILGPDGVFTPTPQGGRDPGECVSLVAWGDEPCVSQSVNRPWPGRLPSPAPATVLASPAQARVLDDHAYPLTVDARCGLSGEPRWLVDDGHRVSIISWAGPWPVFHGWRPESRRVRFQFVLDDGRAAFVVERDGTWVVEGWYD